MTDTQFEKLEQATLKAGLNPDMLAESIERLAARGVLHGPPGALTAAEEQFLNTYSGTTPNADALMDAQLATAIDEDLDATSALTTDQVARLLGGKTPSRIRQMLKEGRLYALPSSKGRGTTLLFPHWQFVQGKAIPHVGEIAEALGESTHPLAVRAFFLNGLVETGEDTMTVREWLLSDGEVAPVTSLAIAETYTL